MKLTATTTSVAARTYRPDVRKEATMWIIAGHVTVDSADRDRYVKAHENLVRRARDAPGCLDLAITADPVDPSRVNSYERWENWDAVESWRAVAAAPQTGIDFVDAGVQAYEISSQRPPF